MKRIFLYKQSDEIRKLNADSGMILFKNFIYYSNKTEDYYYNLHIPLDHKGNKKIPFPELKKDNINITYHKSPGSWYRYHFDANAIKEQYNTFKNDFDLIFTNDIEAVPFLHQLFNVSWHFDIPIFAYWDWVEVPPSGGNINFLPLQLTGVLMSKKTGVNSLWQKNLILKYAEQFFNEDTIKILDQKIQPLYIGMELDEINKYMLKDKPKSNKFRILWNHRINPQTGFFEFLKQMDKLWKENKNFEVLLTNPIKKNTLSDKNPTQRPYIKEMRGLDRKQYFELIQSCDVGIGCFQKYSAWSMSITDVVACEVPVIVPKDFAFEEMLGSDYPLLYSNWNEFNLFLKRLMNKETDVVDELKQLKKKHDWNNRIKDWISFLDFNEKTIDTKTAKHILEFVNKKGRTTKKRILKELNWSKKITWTAYRNYLLKNGIFEEGKNTIYTTEKGKEQNVEEWI